MAQDDDFYSNGALTRSPTRLKEELKMTSASEEPLDAVDEENDDQEDYIKVRERIEEIKRDAQSDDEESPEGTGAIDNVAVEIDIEAENRKVREQVEASGQGAEDGEVKA